MTDANRFNAQWNSNVETINGVGISHSGFGLAHGVPLPAGDSNYRHVMTEAQIETAAK